MMRKLFKFENGDHMVSNKYIYVQAIKNNS